MKNNNPAVVIVIVLGTLLFSYTLYKGICSSFTHDECYTFSNYVTIPVSNIIFYTNCPDIPNNHILNTLLMKASCSLFGIHEWALRLPNLAAHLLFMLYSVIWLKKLKNNVLLVAGFVALNVNMYLLDFFSLARGYGLCACFIFISFYYLWRYTATLKTLHAWISLITGALAAWSNFTALNFYISLVMVYIIFILGKSMSEKSPADLKLKKALFHITPMLIVSIGLYALISRPLATIKDSLFGATGGFYFITTRSIVVSSLQYDEHNIADYVSMFVMTIMVIAGCCYLYDLVKKKFNFEKSPYLLLLLVTILSVLSTIIQYHFFSIPLLKNRTGLFFIVLFNICFVQLYYFLLCQIKKKIMVHAVFFIYPAFLVIVCCYQFRPGYYTDWKYDCNTKEMLSAIKKDIEIHPVNKKVTLGLTWLCEPAVNFYRNADRLSWLNPVSRDGYTGDYDYYFVLDDPGFIENRKLEIIRSYPVSNSVLARPRE